MRAVRHSVPFPVPGGLAERPGGRDPLSSEKSVEGLGRIAIVPAGFGYFRPDESTAPQANQKKVISSARLLCVSPYSCRYGRSLNPTFLLCKRKVPLTVPKKTSRGCSESPPCTPATATL